MTLRVVIADDEPVARRRLRRLLRDDRGVEVVAECGDGAATVDTIRAAKPDLVLLDVQMPELDGFGVLTALAPDEIPEIIFVTAFDRYALRAFDVHALDYLLKPLDPDRLARAMARARERIGARTGRAVDPRVLALLGQIAGERRYLTRMPVKTGGKLILVDLSDVDWIGAADNYVTLHAGGRRHMVRETLGRLERELDPDRFVRIHRSTIVQIDRVKELHADFHGDFRLLLRDGTQLTLSRTYRRRVEALLGRAL